MLADLQPLCLHPCAATAATEAAAQAALCGRHAISRLTTRLACCMRPLHAGDM